MFHVVVHAGQEHVLERDFAAGPLHWTDYDGAEPYLDGDITFDAQQNPAVTVGVQLFGSAGQRTAATGATRYFHADLVGSVGLRSDSSGAASGRITYTAFGEVVTRSAGTEDQRYAYCGEHGYESGLLALDGKPGSEPVTLQHVGARWYQAGVGRFIQRDPLGLRAGRDCYLYCANRPVAFVDPSGLLFGEDWTDGITNGLAHVWLGLAGLTGSDMAKWSDAEVVGAAVVGGVVGGVAIYSICIWIPEFMAATATRGSVEIGWNGGGMVIRGLGAGGVPETPWIIHLGAGGDLGGAAVGRTIVIAVRNMPSILRANGGPTNCVWGAIRAAWTAF